MCSISLSCLQSPTLTTRYLVDLGVEIRAVLKVRGVVDVNLFPFVMIACREVEILYSISSLLSTEGTWL